MNIYNSYSKSNYRKFNIEVRIWRSWSDFQNPKPNRTFGAAACIRAKGAGPYGTGKIRDRGRADMGVGGSRCGTASFAKSPSEAVAKALASLQKQIRRRR